MKHKFCIVKLYALLIVLSLLITAGYIRLKTVDMLTIKRTVESSFIPQRKPVFPDCPVGKMEWRTFDTARLYVPYGIKLERCCPTNYYCWVLILTIPDSSHYALLSDELEGVIKSKIQMYSQVEINPSSVANRQEEVIPFDFFYGLPDFISCDWYMERKYFDNHLLLEHFTKADGREKIDCYCECSTGKTIKISLQSKTKIPDKEIDYIWQIARSLKYEGRIGTCYLDEDESIIKHDEYP